MIHGRPLVGTRQVLYKRDKGVVPCVNELLRTILRNSGHWFGKITMIKDRAAISNRGIIQNVKRKTRGEIFALNYLKTVSIL
ncbi:Hypothetical protein CINCED_3A024655 [Cinara cedri]|uniref:Uncharacterized protein n=1 Tax=Cinara cedri TaxID=506608 RepID=A0A5E4M691_9HEMI|nr:Hypothetical protein CINCED_3A024655 [Cinara cedri]